MGWLEKIIVELLEKYLLPLLRVVWRFIWRFVICPIWKLAFPVVDKKTGIKQSRMKYYLLQFQYQNGETHLAYQEVYSNGDSKGYYDREGKRFFPEHPNENFHIAQEFQFPKWGRIDWYDVFNGDKNSGCWGITER